MLRFWFPSIQRFSALAHGLASLKADEIPVREKAVKALGNVGTAAPEVIPALTSALQDSAPSVRAKAALALLKFGPDASAAINGLTKAGQNDADPNVRPFARKALARINGEK